MTVARPTKAFGAHKRFPMLRVASGCLHNISGGRSLVKLLTAGTKFIGAPGTTAVVFLWRTRTDGTCADRPIAVPQCNNVR